MSDRPLRSDRLRIATFNIKHAAPKDSYRGLPDQLADACRELDADILALQEVDVGVPRSQHADLARVAAEATGMAYYFAKARKHAYRGQYGNALLVRGSIADVEVVKLTGDHRHNVHLGRYLLKPLREPRNAIVATAIVGGHRISVGTGHFAAEPLARQSQLTKAAARLVARPTPRVLLGDFNIPWPQAAEWLAPYGLTLADALTPGEPPADDIDHVAVDGLAIERVEKKWLAISDHRAKIVDATFPSEANAS
jgi:endonuclease/exonuclease/phosphatase family metal-dependent hydrolase